MREAEKALMHDLAVEAPCDERRVDDALRRHELEIIGEIAHAFLNATRPVEVYRLALDRVTPLVGASFSSVFLRDPVDPSLLRLECAYNWPQTWARYLAQVRIRNGRGPTGRAVAEGKPIEIEDVYADPMLSDWWEPSRELGFASLMALPLCNEHGIAGAISFYFAQPHAFDDEERRLLRLIADQLAATAARSQLIEELRAANAGLQQRNEQLGVRIREAEELRRLKDEFLANMSHELRTPLTSILGYAHLLGTGQLGEQNPRQTHAVSRMEAAGQLLLRLVTDMLDLAQLKLGKCVVLREEHDGMELARLAAAEVPGPPPGVHFEIRGSEPAPLITDSEKVRRILTNLLSNAFKFTREGSVTMDVAMRRESTTVVEWVVQDTGIGIAAEDSEAIFDEFRQVDGSMTRPYGGTGLGLALARRLARLLGGDILLQSEPGRGSRFTLRLPERPPLAN
jgi:signal transduction histidine kinase